MVWNFSQAINEGIRQSKAPYVCILNDDVIVSKGWLEPLVQSIKANIGWTNPLSNCDKFWLHQYDMNVGGVDLGPGTCIMNDKGQICLKDNPGVATDCENIYNYKPRIVPRTYQKDWVAFFCTVFSRKVIDKVGYLDEEFRTGSEDLDYCTRANKLGYQGCINENSFVFHFGGVSRKAHEDEDYQKHQEEDKFNNDRIQHKYSRPTILIQTGWAYDQWNGNTLREKGLGGSESWAVYMSEAWVKLGCRVVVFAQTGEPMRVIEGVEWRDQSEWQSFVDMNWIDVCVVSRYVQFLFDRIRARKKYLMLHDIFAMNAKQGDRDLLQEQYDNLDGIFVLSFWHKQFAAQYHGVPQDKFIITGNGIDISTFIREEKECVELLESSAINQSSTD